MTLLEAQSTSQISEAKKFLRCFLYERHSLKSVRRRQNIALSEETKLQRSSTTDGFLSRNLRQSLINNYLLCEKLLGNAEPFKQL